MHKYLTLFLAVLLSGSIVAQQPERPKLVVGIVIDQMRWDYLYRYYDRYAENGGFKRLLKGGFTCENTFIPYAPTLTACGHATIYTGSVPGIHGITGNNWWDNRDNRNVYCTEDATVKTVGSNTNSGLHSPRNMFTSTITDELRIATNSRSKVIGIALKDRGSILPAGHTANAAYWYDNKSGNWITSTYYMNELPGWVTAFNQQKLTDGYYKEGWKTLYPINTYVQSTADEKPYENKTFGSESKGFPYDLSRFAGINYNVIAATPHGNTLSFEFSKAAVNNEQLGSGATTDFLALSLSTPDYVGHSFGPNAIETEDTYLRLDKELGEFLSFLDGKVGKDQYLVFLSADHGAAHAPGFSLEQKLPAGNIDFNDLFTRLNGALRDKFKKNDIVVDISNYQIYLNLPLIESSSLKVNDIKNWILNYLGIEAGVDRAFETAEILNVPLNGKLRDMFANGYHPLRSGQIQLILRPHWIEGFLNGGTTHGSWNPYDAHIPLVWYGWNIKPGRSNREIYMTDIAPTLAALLHIQMPSGTVGKVIEEVVK